MVKKPAKCESPLLLCCESGYFRAPPLNKASKVLWWSDAHPGYG